MEAREELNRLRKALKIADICQASGISSMEAAKASEEDWGLAARAAGFSGYTPSPETQKVVIQLLLDREMAVKKLRPLAIRAWVRERIRMGRNERTDQQITEALICADRMDVKP